MFTTAVFLHTSKMTKGSDCQFKINNFSSAKFSFKQERTVGLLVVRFNLNVHYISARLVPRVGSMKTRALYIGLLSKEGSSLIDRCIY